MLFIFNNNYVVNCENQQSVCEMPSQASTTSAAVISDGDDSSRSDDDEISIITNNNEPPTQSPSVSPLPTSEQLADAYPQGVRMPDMPEKEDDDERWKVWCVLLALITFVIQACARTTFGDD
jgi:hypothetical protein